MAKLDFVDTYIHIIDPKNPALYYPSFQPDGQHPLLGKDIERLKGKRYPASAFLKASQSSNLVASVHVDSGVREVEKELDWLQKEAAQTGHPTVIVPLADLKDRKVEDVLSHFHGFSNVRGVRHRSADNFFVDSAFLRGYPLLEKYGLAFDTNVRLEESESARDLALRYPKIPMLVDHGGMTLATGEQLQEGYFQLWKKRMAPLKAAKNVYCKISGVPLFDHDWTVASLRPWVLTIIDIFGPKRCMFGSHYPYDTLFSTYERLIDAYREIIKDFTLDEQKDMLSRNALAIYRIKV